MRRLLSPTLCFVLVLAAVPAAGLEPGGTFTDDNGSLHEPDIEAVAAEGITRGCNPPANTRFCPHDPVTRGQMAAFLVRALDLTDTGPGFTDTTDSVFAADISRLAHAGITKGCNPPANTNFCPHDPVTREQMATFLRRGLGLEPIVPPPPVLPPPGNPDGNAPVPGEARAEDVSAPDHVIGTGSPDSCTWQQVVDTVALGGTIVFDCGPDPVTITMGATARVFNDADPDVIIDGGGLVTLSGGGERRILYMNTCDPDLVWTTPHCNDQDHPRLTLQNLTFVDGDSSSETEYDGGGAVWVRGGRLKVVNSRFFSNRCAPTGPDVGGAAIRVFDQFQDRPVYVANSTFGGPGDLANVCSNGGAVSSIGVSWTILNSVFTANQAIGIGANPAQAGTPGGGNGGAIYNDGNQMTLRVEGTIVEGNRAREGGGAIFFVSNDGSGSAYVVDSTLTANPSEGFETAGYPGIFFLGRDLVVTGSTLD